jgi:GT2 family glycosyltransferase
MNVPCLSGCFMFLRMQMIKKIGGFDDRFFMYFEDFDLCRRLHTVSKTIYYPFVSIMHVCASEHHRKFSLFKISFISALKYFNKWGWLFDKQRVQINRECEEMNY